MIHKYFNILLHAARFLRLIWAGAEATQDILIPEAEKKIAPLLPVTKSICIVSKASLDILSGEAEHLCPC